MQGCYSVLFAAGSNAEDGGFGYSKKKMKKTEKQRGFGLLQMMMEITHSAGEK